MAKLVVQDQEINHEFKKKIEKKISGRKDKMNERLDEALPGVLGKLAKPFFGAAFDVKSGMDGLKGGSGEADVSALLKRKMPDEWVVMNDVIVEPEPEVFAQTDHIAIGPAGVYVIETKAWQGAFTGFNDHWKRKEGSGWVTCESPTVQNSRHVKLLGAWLEKTRRTGITLPLDKWMFPLVVFADVGWLKTEGCCMPVFKDGKSMIDHILSNKEKVLNPEQINVIVTMLQRPNLARLYMSGEIGKSFAAVPQPAAPPTDSLIEKGIGKNGRPYVRINGSREDAQKVHDEYSGRYASVDKLAEDRYKKGVYYFYYAEKSDQ